jgi:dienelactone hydrolase
VTLVGLSMGGYFALRAASHLMYLLALDEPMAAFEFAMALNEQNLHSELVRQDVLILASRDDHFIPFRLHRKQIERLTAARSVTYRVFGSDEHAQNHCQMGNIRLALQVMAEWLDRLDAEGGG